MPLWETSYPFTPLVYFVTLSLHIASRYLVNYKNSPFPFSRIKSSTTFCRLFTLKKVQQTSLHDAKEARNKDKENITYSGLYRFFQSQEFKVIKYDCNNKKTLRTDMKEGKSELLSTPIMFSYKSIKIKTKIKVLFKQFLIIEYKNN